MARPSQNWASPPAPARSPPPPTRRLALADDAPELQLDGYLYPYFNPAKMKLRVDVEADNSAGADPLTGFLELDLLVDSDPNAPLVAQNAFVSNASYEQVPLTPTSVFALFTILPGIKGANLPVVPFPEVVTGAQVLIDGKAKVQMIRAENFLVPGLVPYDIAVGDHIVNILFNGHMSGAIAFSVTITGATTEYRLKTTNRWSFNGSPQGSWTGTTTRSQAVSATLVSTWEPRPMPFTQR